MNLNPNLPEPLPPNQQRDIAVAGSANAGGGGGAEEVTQASSRQGIRVSGHVVCMAIVVAVSAATIYFMRQYGVRAGIDFDTVTVEYQQPDESKARTYEKIMADLERIQRPMEVALGEFSATPFMLDRPVTTVSPQDPNAGRMSPEELAAEAERRRIEQRREELMMALRSLKVQGVMGGRVPLARISDETYRVGDTIANLFQIVAIEGREVVLEHEGERFTLGMQEPDAGGGSGGNNLSPMRPNRPK